MGKTVKILSIDGGGVRGVIPARVMQELEKRANKPLSELFDFFVGTSTGGILALGATAPDAQGKPLYTAEQGVRFFFDYGHRLFPTHWWLGLRQLWTYKYSSQPLKQLLAERFHDLKLGQALKPTIITTYATNLARPKVFKSWDPYDSQQLMREVARATAAAPTFFEPVVLQNRHYQVTLVDGGVFANNPAMCGLSGAHKQNANLDLEDFFVVSLGAGETEYGFAKRRITHWGAIQWMMELRILHMFIDGSIDAVSYQLNELLLDGHFYRIQTHLSDALSPMDDSRNIPALLKVGDALVKEQSTTLDKIVDHLLNN